MPNSNQPPIRVADLSESVYLPRVSSKPATEPYTPPKTRTNKVLDDNNSQYLWNTPADESSISNGAAGVNASSSGAANPNGAGVAPLESQIHNTAKNSAVPITERYRPPITVATKPMPAKNTSPSAQVASHSSVTATLATASPSHNAPQATERYRPNAPLPTATERTELAELRAQFSRESGTNMEWLDRVTSDLPAALELPKELAPTRPAPTKLDAKPSIARGSELATSTVWGLQFHSVTMGQTLDLLEQLIKQKKPAYAVTANLNYAMLCSQNTRLAEFTKKAALVLCDGKPIQWRSRWNQTKLPERVAGADLIYKLAERCASKKFRVYFYGAAEGVAEQAAAKLKQLYPQLIVAGVQCPPFHASSSEEVRSQIARIKQAKPDVLLVALGQPKGEFWIEDHLQELGVPLSIQLGASFDFVAGTSRRAPKFVQKIGLEWLFRTISDPKRLAPRYFKNLIFLANAIRQDMIDALT